MADENDDLATIRFKIKTDSMNLQMQGFPDYLIKIFLAEKYKEFYKHNEALEDLMIENMMIKQEMDKHGFRPFNEQYDEIKCVDSINASKEEAETAEIEAITEGIEQINTATEGIATCEC